MGLLDALSCPTSQKALPPVSLVFYGKESFHVEHHPRKRVDLWRGWLEARRFGVVALGYARPGELESQLLERLDNAALREVCRVRSRDTSKWDHDLIVTVNYDAVLESVLEPKTTVDAFSSIAAALDQCDRAPLPWKQLTLLILSDVRTWNFDQCVAAAASEDDPVSEAKLPPGMAPELLARYEKAREAAVKDFGLLRSDDLARGVHSTADNVSLVASKWRRKGEIFAVHYGGRPGYFPFQFDPITGRPKPVIAKIISAFPAGTDGWRLALWFTSANPRLSNRRPVDVLDQNTEKVIEAAKGENRGEVF